MIGSYLTRGLAMVFGYGYPAYACYKTVEQNKPEIQQLRFWCQYWILVAVITVCERVGDALVSWIPLYSEAKLAFFIYLWHPKTKGTTYVYESFFKPYVSKHETDIDRNLMELRIKASDMVVLYCQSAVTYGQTRLFKILQFIATQSTPRPRTQKENPTPQKEAPKANQTPNPTNPLPQKKVFPSSKNPLSPKPSSSPRKQKQQPEVSETKLIPLQNKTTPSSSSPSSPSSFLTVPKPALPLEKPAESAPLPPEPEPLPSPPANKSSVPPPPTKETVMEETIRVTRGRLRKARSTGAR